MIPNFSSLLIAIIINLSNAQLLRVTINMPINPTLLNSMTPHSIKNVMFPIKLWWKGPLHARINIGQAPVVLKVELLMDNSLKPKKQTMMFRDSTTHIKGIIYLFMVILHTDRPINPSKSMFKDPKQPVLANILLILQDLRESLHTMM
jgi:hypothetical protein